MNLLHAIILGAIQGATEFLPISSSAHIRVVPALVGWPDPGAAFTANIQLGTIVAVFVYFWSDLSNMGRATLAGLKDKAQRDNPDFRLALATAVGSVPIIVLGLLLKSKIEHDFRALDIVAGGLIGMGILLLVAERLGKKNRSVDDVTWKDGVLVGLWQACALVPGASRSGSTITGGMFAGFSREDAARFSFILSVPSITLAGLYTLVADRKELAGLATPLVVANVVSFVVGYACIKWLMNILKKQSVMMFVVYRLILGLALFYILSTGLLSRFAGMSG